MSDIVIVQALFHYVALWFSGLFCYLSVTFMQY